MALRDARPAGQLLLREILAVPQPPHHGPESPLCHVDWHILRRTNGRQRLFRVELPEDGLYRGELRVVVHGLHERAVNTSNEESPVSTSEVVSLSPTAVRMVRGR